MVASTSEIYGKSTNGALAEGDDRILGAPTTARWGYANAKVFGEMLAYGFHREHGAANTVIRFFNTVGPRQSGAYGMVVPRFVEQALAGEPLTIYGDGTQARCFTHVADSVDAIVRLLDEDRAIGNVYNVGRPKAVTVQDLAHRVLAITGSDSEIVYVPYEEAYGDGFEELGRRCPDTTAVETLTGWRSRFDVDRAINDIIAHDRATDDVIAHDRSMDGAVIA
jgi:UDP-glucose 4-epimerase